MSKFTVAVSIQAEMAQHDDTDRFKELGEELFVESRRRVRDLQNGVPRRFDAWLAHVETCLAGLPERFRWEVLVDIDDDPDRQQMFPWAVEFREVLERREAGR